MMNFLLETLSPLPLTRSIINKNLFTEGKPVYNLITRRYDSIYNDKRCFLTPLVDVGFLGTLSDSFNKDAVLLLPFITFNQVEYCISGLLQHETFPPPTSKLIYLTILILTKLSHFT